MVQRSKRSTKASHVEADRALARIREIDVFSVECPAHQVVKRVGNKWTLLVIYALSQGTKRYTDLQKKIGAISPKMLTEVLRNLEDDALVSRKVHPVVPPMVEYDLTPLGFSLAVPLAGLCVWAEDNYSLLRDSWRLSPQEVPSPRAIKRRTNSRESKTE
ncbi:winged helix-turn-helix transcriptional regulator [Hyphomicrobium sp.]|uniref:winged helix-turn-helix transcriptional regulator n=1 Tax=Hyphomicrobium sp. TaxID=82 RepID=UPI002FDF516D